MAQTAEGEVRIGPQGRLVVPARIRQALSFRPGDTLVASIEDGRLILEKQEAVLARLKIAFAQIPPEVSLVDELIAERREEARREQAR